MKYVNFINVDDRNYLLKLFQPIFATEIFEDANGLYLIIEEDQQLVSIELIALEANLKIMISHARDYLFQTMMKYSFKTTALVVHISDLVFIELCTNNQEVITVLKKTFMSIEEHLIFTAQAYLHHNFNSVKAAKTIYVHRNTFHYRLQQFIELSGVDIRDYRNALLFDYYLKLK